MDYKEQLKTLLSQIVQDNNRGLIPMVVEESLREVCPEVMQSIDLNGYNVYYKHSTMRRYMPLFSTPRSKAVCHNYMAEYKKRLPLSNFQIRIFR